MSITSSRFNPSSAAPSALQVATPRPGDGAHDKPISAAKSDALACTVAGFVEALPAGVAEPGSPPADKNASGLLNWLGGLFDSIRRHVRRESAADMHAHAAAHQILVHVDQTEAAVSDCVRQHDQETDHGFASRIASLFTGLATRLRQWLSRDERPRSGALPAQPAYELNAQDVTRWKSGTVDRDDLFGLASDPRKLQASLARVPGLPALRDAQGDTLAHIVAGCGVFNTRAGAEAICDILATTAGVDLAAVNAQGDTPLHRAAAFASHPDNAQVVLPALVTRAVQDGFDFGRHDAGGMTVLQRAVVLARPEAVDRLLAPDVDPGIDALSRSGGTALCHALDAQRLDIAKKLLERGANPRLGQIDNLPPKVWLAQTIGAARWLRQECREAGDIEGADSAQDFIAQAEALLQAMAEREIPAAALR